MEYPEVGLRVKINLNNGTSFFGYWDGERWWVGVDKNPDDAPLDPSFVESWSAE